MGKALNTSNINIRIAAALALIIIINVSGYLFLKWMFASQHFEAGIIDRAGRQRMLAQKITNTVLILVQTKEARSTDLREELKELQVRWSSVHQALKKYGTQDKGEENRVATLFRRTEPSFKTFESSVKKVIALTGEKSHRLTLASGPIQALLKAETEYVSLMDVIVDEFAKGAQRQITRIEVAGVVMTAVTMVFIIISILFIFVPMKATIEKEYTMLQREIEERRSAEGRIKELNEDLQQRVLERTAQLKASNAELADLAYSISHEFRAPLRAINAFSTILAESDDLPRDSQTREKLIKISEAASHLGKLVDAVLFLTHLANKTVQKETLNLSKLAAKCSKKLEASHPDRTCKITIKEGIVVEADRELLEVVVDQLLDNAWKFTARREQCEIEFGKTFSEGKEAFFVRDNGVGFDMAHVRTVFRTFFSAHSPGEYEGIGIGMAIVERIIRRHGGEIWAWSEVGKGATFYFTL
jgi:signal transduction histidine kinase